jgi:hypothetical protein
MSCAQTLSLQTYQSSNIAGQAETATQEIGINLKIKHAHNEEIVFHKLPQTLNRTEPLNSLLFPAPNHTPAQTILNAITLTIKQHHCTKTSQLQVINQRQKPT